MLQNEHNIIKNESGTFQLDLERAKELVDKQEHLSARVIGDTVFIKSRLDEWYIVQKGSKLKLFHKNNWGYSQDGFHLQRERYATPTGLIHCIQHIISHDRYTMNGGVPNKKRKSKMERLFESIEPKKKSKKNPQNTYNPSFGY